MTEIKFWHCSNCGFSSPRRDEFTLDWCDECAQAGVKGFVAAIAAGLGTMFLAGIWQIAARVW